MRLAFLISNLLILALCSALATEFSASVEQITRGPKSHFFGYVGHGGTIPWNASDRFIVALQTDFHDRMPKPGEAAQVVLIDTENDYRVEPVDRTLAWNLQQGTMLFWNPDAAEAQFFFNDMDPETGVVFTVLYDIAERRRVREYRFGAESIGNGGVSPAGKYFAGINYGKITRSREVISYPGASDHTVDENPPNPDSDGVFRIDIATGDRQLLASYAELSDLILATENNRRRIGDPDKYPIYAHHTMWSRDGEWIFFLVRGKQNKLPDQACAIRFDGSDLRKVPYAGHPEWSARNELILASKEHGAYNLYDVAQKKWTGQLGGPGVFLDTRDDNALSPDGTWHVGSQKIDAECFYTYFRLADGHWFRSPAVSTKVGGGVVRIDPAPRWNRAGDRILAPGLAADGTRQLFLVKIARPFRT